MFSSGVFLSFAVVQPEVQAIASSQAESFLIPMPSLKLRSAVIIITYLAGFKQLFQPNIFNVSLSMLPSRSTEALLAD